jgi:hypothetical protein
METTPADSRLDLAASPYYRTVEGVLRRGVLAMLPVPFSGLVAAEVCADEASWSGTYQAVEGVTLVDGPPASDQESLVEARIACDAGSWRGTAALGPARLWTIYVTQDKHLDYGWLHPVEDVVLRMNDLVDYHLRASDRIGLRWNLSVSIWVEEYLRTRPDSQAQRLLDALQSGRFEVAALWLVPFPGIMDTEEVLQCLDYARHLENAFGVPVKTASLQEVPSLPWGFATLLAGAGIPYVAKGAYDLRNPHLKERDPLPLATWEGPDGSTVLLRWDAYAGTHSWGGYAEAYSLWRADSDAERIRFVEDTVSRYEGYADYPVDAILLDGVGMDEYPQTETVSEFINSFNARGWEYPRLVDATWSDFWEAVEGQLGSERTHIPVIRGDWGSSWEEWPAQLARLNSIYRRAREVVLSAQVLSAVADGLDPEGYAGRAAPIADAWRGLLQFADHNIGGADPATYADMRDRKAAYVYTAMREGTRALQASVSVMASAIPGRDGGRRLLVSNPSSWNRSEIVEVVVPEDVGYAVRAVDNGDPIPCQLVTRGPWPEHYLSFVADDIPPFGYRCFDVDTAPGSANVPQPAPAECVIENGFYRLAIDPETGGLRSVWDKTVGREVVDPQHGVALNEYLHHSNGTLHRPQVASIQVQDGPLGPTMIVETSALRSSLRTTYRLYNDLQRVDIVNDLAKEPSSEPQCSWFAFPLAVEGREYAYDGPGAIVRARLSAEGGDLLPGAARTCVAARSFLASSNAEFSLVLASPDANLFQFGASVFSDPTSDSDFDQSLALSLAMHNFTRNDRAVEQGGHRTFQFRYSLTGTAGAFSRSAAVRFARGVCQSLPALWATGDDDAPLVPTRYGFLSISPANVVATGLKVASDGDGWVLRLWECEGLTAEVTVDLAAMGATCAAECDLLERRSEPLAVQEGRIRLVVPAHGLRAVRFSRG